MDLWNLRGEIVFRDLRITLGRHPETGAPCLLFMVQLGFGEYPARLRLSEEEFKRFQQRPELAVPLTDRYQGLSREQVRALGAEC